MKVEDELSFDAWCFRKDEFDKGLKLLEKLDPSRWEDEAKYNQASFLTLFLWIN